MRTSRGRQKSQAAVTTVRCRAAAFRSASDSSHRPGVRATRRARGCVQPNKDDPRFGAALCFEHPGVLAAAALGRIYDERAFSKRDSSEAARKDSRFSAEQHEGAEVY